MGDLTDRIEGVRADMERRPSFAQYDELRQLLGSKASHSALELVFERLKSADLLRFVFLSVIQLLNVRFLPDHERVVELLKVGAAHDVINKLPSNFASTWWRDTMPQES